MLIRRPDGVARVDAPALPMMRGGMVPEVMTVFGIRGI
jgi:hypothetical protein